MLEHTYREIVLRNGKREKIKLAVDFEDPDYSLLGIFLATEAGTFHREIAEELDAILQGEKETGEFLGNRCQVVVDGGKAGIFDAIAEDGVGRCCFVPTDELRELLAEWKARSAEVKEKNRARREAQKAGN